MRHCPPQQVVRDLDETVNLAMALYLTPPDLLISERRPLHDVAYRFPDSPWGEVPDDLLWSDRESHPAAWGELNAHDGAQQGQSADEPGSEHHGQASEQEPMDAIREPEDDEPREQGHICKGFLKSDADNLKLPTVFHKIKLGPPGEAPKQLHPKPDSPVVVTNANVEPSSSSGPVDVDIDPYRKGKFKCDIYGNLHGKPMGENLLPELYKCLDNSDIHQTDGLN